MNTETSAQTESDSSLDTKESTPLKRTQSLHWKVEFILLCVMLALALIGMAVTQAYTSGAWEYWLFAVLVFAGIGFYRDMKFAKQHRHPILQSAIRQLLHWGGLLIVMKALVAMERFDGISRESASVAALMLLALTCYLAGLHFHWSFAIVGIVLAVMAVVLGTMEQYLLIAWLIMVPVVIAGAAVFYMRGKKKSLET